MLNENYTNLRQLGQKRFISLSFLVSILFLSHGIHDAKGVALPRGFIGSSDGAEGRLHSNILHTRQRKATYDQPTNQCVCADARRFAVLPGLLESQKAGYCVSVCGDPVTPDTSVSDSSSNPSPTSTTQQPTSTSTPKGSDSATSSSNTPSAPTAPVAPTAPTAPTAPAPPVAPTAPTAPSPPSPPGTNSGTGTTAGGPPGDPNPPAKSSDGWKIGLGVALGVIMTGALGLCALFYIRKKKQQQIQDNRKSAMIMCRGHGGEDGHHTVGIISSASHPPPPPQPLALQIPSVFPPREKQSEKYIYSNGPPPHGHPALFGHDNGNDSPHSVPESPTSVPPAYSSSATSNNSSMSSVISTADPPVLPLGAPSRFVDWSSQTASSSSSSTTPHGIYMGASSASSSQPSSSDARVGKHEQSGSMGSVTGPVVPPSITFFLHPVKKEEGLEEDELKWLDGEQRRIREKAEAVKELGRLKEEEERLKKRIRERTLR